MMMSQPVARRLPLAILIAVAGFSLAACNPRPEGDTASSTVEVVVPNAQELQVPNESLAHVCSVSFGQERFVVFKGISEATSEVTHVWVARVFAGDFDQQTNICELRNGFVKGTPGLYRAVATDGDNWVTRCADTFQFFLTFPSGAQQVLQFTQDVEDCEHSFEGP